MNARPALLAIAGLALAACSSSSSRPGALGNCVAGPDASCSPYGSGSGGGSGPTDGGGGTPDTGSVSSDSGSCGTALLNTQNLQCQPCVVASCCQADLQCTGQCLSLVQCSGGINTCEAQYPAGITAYNDLADCLTQSCPTQCPTLPKATAGDF